MENLKRIEKGWGHELIIVNENGYCGKILNLQKNKKCSWHYHKLKTETFYLEKGRIKLFYGYDHDIKKSQTIILNPGNTFHIPTTLVHRFYGITDSRIYEFSTTHYESDSYRIEKGD